MKEQAEIGIIGGSGFYSMLENKKEIKVETPYGAPSDLIAISEAGGKKVAFLPRHGKLHQYPPHMINYRANIWALKELGVKRIIAPAAVGSLNPNIRVGDFVVSDQFVDRTSGRISTFYSGPITTHISTAFPYCPILRDITIKSIAELSLPVHTTGTVVVIEGPRFSTKAESEWFTKMGWDIINMTQFPEVVLARELEMCYVNISVVTDYDVGIVAGGEVEPVSQESVIKKFKENMGNLINIIEKMIPMIPEKRDCECAIALKDAKLG